jgi:hypothetical protein
LALVFYSGGSGSGWYISYDGRESRQNKSDKEGPSEGNSGRMKD